MSTPSPPASPSPEVVRLAEAPRHRGVAVLLEPDAEARAALARDLGIPAIRKLRLEGTLSPMGRADWRLDATLGATVVQDCVVTLAPVTTRIDEPVERAYLERLPEAQAGEVEMPQDDSVEPLPAALDLREVLREALALALPPFPRAAGAELGEVVVTGPGAAPLTAEAARPFAALRGLVAREGEGGGEGGGGDDGERGR